jgi:predicted RNase H-like HicB family nuclease
MTFVDYLRVPYLLRSSTVRSGDGQWLRHVEYPELPGCSASAPDLLDALDELDRRRVHVILDLLADGGRPPLPRAPLPGASPVAELERLGLSDLGLRHDDGAGA